MSTIIPATSSQVTATINSAVQATSNASLTGTSQSTLAQNFQAFLQLLTTQLKNQNPLDPLDTNQFTQQLVQFAQVEQQLKSNDQLSTLVSLQKTAQSTQALEFVGHTVAVDGATAPLTNGEARWSLTIPKPAVATINILAENGQTVYSGTFNVNAGKQPFVWDGRDSSGQQWPAGNYKIVIAAEDANRQPVSIPTEIEALVDSADLTKSPPVLTIAGQEYTLDKIKRVIRN
ncbi:MAG: flagellar biosynthesis protein FlgD [Alphaproteobacteria bacterium]|nr:flagellar biosynthesis protein FlgD [Alphaproteobacteria bacterium]